MNIETIRSCLILLFLLGAIPLGLGLQFKSTKIEASIIYSYIIGFFIMLAIFAIFCVPACMIDASFSAFAYFYLTVVIGVCLIRIRSIVANFKYIMGAYKVSVSKYKVALIIILFGLLFLQSYKMYISDMSYNAGDDATYLVYSSAAVEDDHMYMTNPFDGNAITKIEAKRFFQAYNFFPAYLCKISGVSVASIEHTFLAILLIIISYGVVYLCSKWLLDENKDRLLFTIFIALLYVFGSYSHYSSSFRLLGVIWQGKAMLAVILGPFFLVYYVKWVHEELSYEIVLLITCISITAVSLTMGGIVTILAISCIVTAVDLIKKNRSKTLIWYLLFSNVYPAIAASYYLIER